MREMDRRNFLGMAAGGLLSCADAWLPHAFAADSPRTANPATPGLPSWSQVRPVTMRGDWKVFWNVGGGDVQYNNREAVSHGFRLVNLVGTYADYPGNQKENIDHALKGNRTDPWKKPEYFERIIRRNIAQAGRDGEILVHDIEFDFEEDVDKAWNDPAARAASGARDQERRLALRSREKEE